jgi:hypothetical protein
MLNMLEQICRATIYLFLATVSIYIELITGLLTQDQISIVSFRIWSMVPSFILVCSFVMHSFVSMIVSDYPESKLCS